MFDESLHKTVAVFSVLSRQSSNHCAKPVHQERKGRGGRLRVRVRVRDNGHITTRNGTEDMVISRDGGFPRRPQMRQRKATTLNPKP
jgi:hypothetical protein